MTREKLEHWFWRGLTAVVFAWVLAMCFMPAIRAASPLAVAAQH